MCFRIFFRENLGKIISLKITEGINAYNEKILSRFGTPAIWQKNFWIKTFIWLWAQINGIKTLNNRHITKFPHHCKEFKQVWGVIQFRFSWLANILKFKPCTDNFSFAICDLHSLITSISCLQFSRLLLDGCNLRVETYKKFKSYFQNQVRLKRGIPLTSDRAKIGYWYVGYTNRWRYFQ